MGKEIDEYCERLSRLVEYAKGGKNPSIWWNGVEYKWDKKHGKYLHWSTLPNGEKRADEPPYEAMNPLFSAVGIPPTNDKKGETPKVEKKEEEKEKKPVPKPEPVVGPKTEPENEKELTSPTTDNPQIDGEKEKPKEEENSDESNIEDQDQKWLTERGDYRGLYRSLMEKAVDFDSLSEYFQTQYREELSYALNNEFVPTHHFNLSDDDINDILKAKNIVNDSSVLPDVRRIVLIGAVSKLDYGNSNPFPLALDLANGNLSFPDALEAVKRKTKWLNVSDYEIARTWKNVESRADALKVVSKHTAARFASAQDNTEIEERIASLLKLAESPTTSNVEALYLASRLNSLENNIKSRNYEYSNVAQGVRKGQESEEKKQWFKSHGRKMIFDELGRIEKDVAVLRERAQNEKDVPPPSEPETPPKAENTTPEEKPAPPMTVNHPIGREKEEQSAESEKKAPVVPSFQQIDRAAVDYKKSFSEKNDLVKEWADSFFPDGERFSAVKGFLTSDDVPFYAKKSMIAGIYRATELDRIRRTAERNGENVPEFGTVQELLDYCSLTSIRNQSEMTRAMADYASNLQSKLEADWESIQHDGNFTETARPYWDGLYPFHRNLRFGKDAPKFGDRDSAIKNFRSLIKIPGVLSKEEKQTVLDRIAYIGALAKLPTTTDEEACMMMSKIQSIGQSVTKNAQFAKNFDAQFQSRRFQEKLDEIASRSDAAPERPKPLSSDSKDEDEPSNSDKGSPGYAASAKNYASAIESVRNEEMTPEEAERDRAETQKLLDICDQVERDDWSKDQRQIDDLHRTYIDDIVDRARKLESIQAYTKIKHPNAWSLGARYYEKMLEELDGPESARVPDSEKDAIHSLLEEYKDKDARYKAAVKELYRQEREQRHALSFREGVPYDHEKTLKFLKKAFPDRGGAVFFPQEWRDEVLKTFERQNPEFVQVAKEVLDVYDIIGRCFNIGGREFKTPTVKFGYVSKGNLGECAGNRFITLSSTRLNNPEQVRMTFAHELGHWIENEICGVRRINDNAGWIKENTGHLQLEKRDQWEWQRKKTPRLTVDPTGYSYRLYKISARIIGRTKEFHGCTSTELISTGMEFLTAFPTLFVERSPKHLDLLIKNFEVISQHDRKDE